MKTLVPVSDEIKSQIITRVHEDFTLRNGMTPVNDTFPETKKAYIMASRPDQRISVGWTLLESVTSRSHGAGLFYTSAGNAPDLGGRPTTEYRPKCKYNHTAAWFF